MGACCAFLTGGCADVLRTTGDVAYNVVKFTGIAVYKTTKFLVDIPSGRRTVPLQRRGNMLYVNALLNGRVNAVLTLDTGCAHTQISSRVAARLGLDRSKAQPIQCGLAGGRVVTGRVVYIKEIRIDSVRAFDVPAVVLDDDRGMTDDGLLGMSFLDNFIFKIDTDRQTLTFERKN